MVEAGLLIPSIRNGAGYEQRTNGFRAFDEGSAPYTNVLPLRATEAVLPSMACGVRQVDFAQLIRAADDEAVRGLQAITGAPWKLEFDAYMKASQTIAPSACSDSKCPQPPLLPMASTLYR